MKPSKSQPVQNFLDDVAALDGNKFRIVQKLREIVFAACPDVNERIIYGEIMFSVTEDFGGVFAYKNHISFEFGQGIEFRDPDQHLEGKGKFRRHLKLASLTEIDTKQVDFFVRQAV